METLFNEYVQSIETYIMFRIKQEAQNLAPELERKGRAPIPLAMGAPVLAPPEFVTDKLVEALKLPGIHTYSSPKGEAFYREAIAERMKNRFGVELDPESEIFSLIGSKEGIANFIRALINPKTNDFEKDIILIPDPGYASYKEMIKTNGGLGYPVPLTKENKFMPDFDDVLENLKRDGFSASKIKALMINYPGNPTGATCTREYLEKAVSFCKKLGICLISDAAYCDIYFDESERPISVFEIDGAKDVAVEFYSFSKPYAMTGWRLGWVCGNKEAVTSFGKLKSTIDSGLFKALQKAASEVLNSKEGDEYIQEACKGFKRKQMIIVNGLKELGWIIDDIPKATFYLWLPIPPKYKYSTDFTNDLLRKSGIVAVPGIAFGNNGEGYFRISAVSTDEKLQEAIQRMKIDGFYFG